MSYLMIFLILFMTTSCGMFCPDDNCPKCPDCSDCPIPQPDPDPDPDPDPQPNPDPDPPVPPTPGKHPLLIDYPNVDYTGSGKYRVKGITAGRVKLTIATGAPRGSLIPLAWNNGTTASCGMYASALQDFATKGTAVGCYESTNTGSGVGCMEAIRVLLTLEETDKSIIAIAGHSQGGGAALTCHELAERKYGKTKKIVSFGVEPAHGMGNNDYVRDYGKITGAVYLMSGSRDTSVSAPWVRRGWVPLKSEKYWFEAQGVSHISWMMRPKEHITSSGIAWFRWKLLNDERSKSYFLALPNSSKWRNMGRSYLLAMDGFDDDVCTTQECYEREYYKSQWWDAIPSDKPSAEESWKETIERANRKAYRL